MSYKMKGSPFQRNFGIGDKKRDYSKKHDYTYDPDSTGAKIAKFFTPDISGDNTAWENIKGASDILPIGKLAKTLKYAYRYISGDKDKKKT